MGVIARERRVSRAVYAQSTAENGKACQSRDRREAPFDMANPIAIVLFAPIDTK